MKIAVDVDGVLADIHTPVFRELGLPYTWKDVKAWDFYNKMKGLNKEKYMEAYRKVWKQKWHDIQLIDPEAPAVLKDLFKRHRIDIVTSREKDLEPPTVLWLVWKRIPFVDIVLVPPGADKTELEFYDLFVDDNPEMAKDRERVILFDRPWNSGVPFVRRIKKFRELYKYVEGKKSGVREG